MNYCSLTLRFPRASQDVMVPDGPMAFPSQICRCNTKKAAQSAIHGERGNRCIDGFIYACCLKDPSLRLLQSLPARRFLSLLVWATSKTAFWTRVKCYICAAIGCPKPLIKGMILFQHCLAIMQYKNSLHNLNCSCHYRSFLMYIL